MDNKKLIVDTLIADYFDGIQSEIKKKTAAISQDFVSRGLSNSTACTSALVAVYYKEFNKRIDRIFSFIEEKVLTLDWNYLETQLHKHVEQIFSKAEAAACKHLVDAGLASTIPCYCSDIVKKKKEALDVISNKIRLVSMLRLSTVKTKATETEIVEVKFGFGGITINIKEIGRRIKRSLLKKK